MLAGLPVGWPLPGGWNLLRNGFSVCGACADARLAPLLGAAGLLLQGAAGLPVGWPLPGGWNLVQNGLFFIVRCIR